MNSSAAYFGFGISFGFLIFINFFLDVGVVLDFSFFARNAIIGCASEVFDSASNIVVSDVVVSRLGEKEGCSDCVTIMDDG